MAAFEEDLADGQAGKQMSASSACCDDEVHGEEKHRTSNTEHRTPNEFGARIAATAV
jgi:hypothetical protein